MSNNPLTTTPPTCEELSLNDNVIIYVQDSCVDAFKEKLVSYVDRIRPMSEYNEGTDD